MQNCLTCSLGTYDDSTDTYFCKARQVKIYILLEPEECKSYEKSEETES